MRCSINGTNNIYCSLHDINDRSSTFFKLIRLNFKIKFEVKLLKFFFPRRKVKIINFLRAAHGYKNISTIKKERKERVKPTMKKEGKKEGEN